jgi:OPA family glycerol-3-phosphate transporter-like MFS transporter
MGVIKSKAKWEQKIIFCIVFGYAAYYFVRQNFNIIFADKNFGESFNYLYLGWAFTANSIIYGVGKVINGYISDRCSSRIFFSLGLLISGSLSVISAFQLNTHYVLIIFIINGWFQSMGFPATAKLIMNWTEKSKIGSRWSFATSSHQIGGIFIAILGTFILENFGWKETFIFSGSIAIIISIVLYNFVRDSYHEVDITFKDTTIPPDPSPLKLMIRQLFISKELQILCLGNMLAYSIRMGILNWAPIFLVQYYKSSIVLMGISIGIYEAMGLLGCLTIGCLIDKFFSNKLGQLGAFCMLLFTTLLYLLSNLRSEQELLNFIVLGIIGFVLYIPQILVGIISTRISKNDIGIINGFIGLSGYLGCSISGIGNAIVLANYGWEGSFYFFIIIGIISFSVFWGISLLEKLRLNQIKLVESNA